MKLIFTDDYVNINSEHYAHYLRRKYSNLDERIFFCDIQSYIHKNQQSIIADIEKWHANICNFYNPKIKYWWLTLSSRLIIFHPPVFEPLIFAIGVIEYCNKHHLNSLQLINCPNEVLQYIKELSPSLEIIDQRNYSNKQKSHTFINLFKIAKFAVKFVINSFSYLVQKKEIRKIKNLVFTYSVSQENLEKYDDRYYGQMFDDDVSLKYDDTLWLFVQDGMAAIHNNLENKKWKFDNVFNYLTVFDVFKCLYSAIWEFLLLFYYSRKTLPIELSSYISSTFYKNYVNELLLSHLIVNELATYHVIKKILLKHEVKNIIFPMEGKSMEKAILLAANEDNLVKTIGYMHSFAQNLDSCLKSHSNRGIESELEPDIIATPGKNIIDWMEKWGGVPREKLINFGSYKHQNLIPRESNKVKPCVLIVLSINIELFQLANLIESDRTVFDSYEVVLRPGPTFVGQEQDEQINRILSMTSNIKLNSSSMYDQIKWSDFVIFNITSVGIEAVLLGRLAIYLSLSNIIEIDSLEGRANKENFFYSKGIDQLKSNMLNIIDLKDAEYDFLLSKQYEDAKYIYSEIDLVNINKALG
jgi:hypothetical protein